MTDDNFFSANEEIHLKVKEIVSKHCTEIEQKFGAYGKVEFLMEMIKYSIEKTFLLKDNLDEYSMDALMLNIQTVCIGAKNKARQKDKFKLSAPHEQ